MSDSPGVLIALPRAERSRSARARCSRCRKSIDKGVFRVVVPGEIMATGFQHVACAAAERNDLDVVVKNSALSREEAAALRAEWPTPKRAPPSVEGPAVSHDDDLVLADELSQRGDVRGEMLLLAQALRECDTSARARGGERR